MSLDNASSLHVNNNSLNLLRLFVESGECDASQPMMVTTPFSGNMLNQVTLSQTVKYF